jgi:hypothetical protein
MGNKQLAVLVVTLLVIQVFASCVFFSGSRAQTTPDVYVGIDISYGGVDEAKAMIDKVSNYTNLIVIGTTQITWYQDRLTETFQYAYDKGLSFISLTPALSDVSFDNNPSKAEWFAHAKEAWGDRLLGFYYLDEPGGRQLDSAQNWIGPNTTTIASSYTDATDQFTSAIGRNVEWTKSYSLNSSGYPVYTSDYALYWFDYKAGYDTIFAEFGWNLSRSINVALCRGAATAYNRDWGAIITWTYMEPPYIESGEELYKDLVFAYDNGAKYIVVFDGNEGWTQSILKPEHYESLQQFWDYVQNNPRKTTPVDERTAYALPSGYGYGFRGPQDHIWGLWEADDFSHNLSLSVGSLLRDYGAKLDIIYEDSPQPVDSYGYKQVFSYDSYSPPPPKISILSPENTTYTIGNVSLTFTIDKPTTWIGYSLDGQEQVPLNQNTTLYNLADGPHNITIYAKDEFESTGNSETIHFTIDPPDPPEPFPTTAVIIIATSAVSAAVVTVGLAFYFKKRNH